MLTFSEAYLFLRFGEDMRWTDWPAGDFARFVVGTVPILAGYTSELFIPTTTELGDQWQRA